MTVILVEFITTNSKPLHLNCHLQLNESQCVGQGTFTLTLLQWKFFHSKCASETFWCCVQFQFCPVEVLVSRLVSLYYLHLRSFCVYLTGPFLFVQCQSGCLCCSPVSSIQFSVLLASRPTFELLFFRVQDPFTKMVLDTSLLQLEFLVFLNHLGGTMCDIVTFLPIQTPPNTHSVNNGLSSF